MKTDPLLGRGRLFLFYSLFIALLFLTLRGYVFNSEGQAEHLPPVYQRFDPLLYPADYFMTAYRSAFNVRNFFEYFVYALSLATGVPAACFLLTVASIATASYSLSRLSASLGGGLWAQTLAPLLALFVFYRFTVGGNYLTYNLLVGSVPAKALGLAALALFFERKYRISALLLGFAALWQPLAGLQLFLVLYGVLWLNFQNENRSIYWRFPLFFSLLAVFVLVPTLYRQFGDNQPDAGADFNAIMYAFRNTLHYYPRLFPWKDYARFVALLVAAGLAAAWVPMKNRKIARQIVGVVLAGCAVYTVLVEGLDAEFALKVQGFKTTIWVQALASATMATALGHFLEKRFSPPPLYSLSGVGALFCVFPLFFSAYLPLPFAQDRWKLGFYKPSDLTLLHEWIAENTPKDAVFLTPPNDFSFGCEAKRSAAIGYKAIVHEKRFMTEWYAQYRYYYQVAYDTLGNRSALSVAVENYETRPVDLCQAPQKIDYRIDNLKRCQFQDQLGEKVKQTGHWALTRVAPCQPNR